MSRVDMWIGVLQFCQIIILIIASILIIDAIFITHHKSDEDPIRDKCVDICIENNQTVHGTTTDNLGGEYCLCEAITGYYLYIENDEVVDYVKVFE